MTQNYKNPNRLLGHEGYLLKTREPLVGYTKCKNERKRGDIDGWEGRVDVPSGQVGLIVACDDNDGNIIDWLDFLYEDRVARVFFSHNSWMRYFIPWPAGAFIHND